jgi:hypothetical protein
MTLEFSLFQYDSQSPSMKREYHKSINASSFDVDLGPEVLIEGGEYRF